jgi:hypothetical protein
MSTNGTSSLREKIAFQANMPTLLTLDHSDGQPCAGRFGEQYMYTFDGGKKIAWLDPDVRKAILATGAGAGDQIFVTRNETREGNRKHVTWNVERVEDEPAQAPARPASKPPATCTRPGPDAPRPTASAPQASSSNGAARAALADALAIAIDVAAEAEQLASRKGLAVRFQAEDIRALALTVYIGSSRGERRAA